MDEIAIELGVALGGAAVLFHEAPQALSGLLRHGGVGLPLLFAQIHGLSVQLKLLLRFLAVLRKLLLPFHLLLCLTADLFLREEKAVEHPVKCDLLLPGFGVDSSKGSFTRSRSSMPRAISSRAASSVSLGLTLRFSRWSIREKADSFSR